MGFYDIAARLGWPAADNFLRHAHRRRALEDLPYAGGDAHRKRRLDLFLPPDGVRADRAALFVHGGAWKAQDRKLLRGMSGLYGNVGLALAARGIATAVMGYRQPPEGDARSAIEDVLAALGWMREGGREHGFESDRLLLVGHSAGGHLAALVALDARHGHEKLEACVSLAGFYDASRLVAALPVLAAARARNHFRAPDDGDVAAEWSPERWLPRSGPPFVLLVGGREPAPLRAEHDAMSAALARGSMPYRAETIDGLGHMGLALEMGRRHDRVTPRLLSLVEAVRLRRGDA